MELSPTIVRTERGLTLAGTRITLYDILDYVTSGWPPTLIAYRLNLADQQIADALAYLDTHRADVEAEYLEVLRQAQEIRAYWEERNRERFAARDERPRPPGQEQLWEKLQAQKARITSPYCGAGRLLIP